MVNVPDGYPDRVRQNEFAVLLGISPAMVNKHKNAGRLVMDGRLVVVRDSIDLIARVKDPARGGDRNGHPALAMTPPPGATPPLGRASIPDQGDPDRLNYNAEAARHKRAEAQRSELMLAREAGELVSKRERDAAEFGRARAGREAVMSIADRISVRVAAESDAHACYRIIEAECRRVCDLLAGIEADNELDQAA